MTWITMDGTRQLAMKMVDCKRQSDIGNIGRYTPTHNDNNETVDIEKRRMTILYRNCSSQQRRPYQQRHTSLSIRLFILFGPADLY